MIALLKALLWPTYTNIGADDRDQFAMVRSMPGNLTNVVAQLHGRGVQVLWSVTSRHLLPPPSPPPCARWHSLPVEPPLRVRNNVVDLPHLNASLQQNTRNNYVASLVQPNGFVIYSHPCTFNAGMLTC